jgi:DNA-binding SARP family transcriptional activator/tetratricopeptide (TPR) repeat protein
VFPPARGPSGNTGICDNEGVSAEKAQVRVRLLGPFAVTSDGREAGPWPRPTARRLCQLVLVSPGRRISRDLACDELFPGQDPRSAARSVSKALSMARAALAALGPAADGLLAADLTHIWATPDAEVDAEETERALRAALAMEPGQGRDTRLVAALSGQGELLADEPYADWALAPRERLEALRQEARLALARDRSRGAGQARPEAVLAAWAACFERDPAAEEAAGALVQAYFAAGHRDLAVRVYERCRAALGELGVGISPWLEEVYATAAFEAVPSRSMSSQSRVSGPAAAPREELRTVSVLSAEVVPAGDLDPERLRDAVGRGLSAVIAAAEAFGGTVTSVSGHGVQAVFGAPEAHEDDPERAARAAFRALSSQALSSQALSSQAPSNQALASEGTAGATLRIGLETGPAVLGPIGGGGRVEYGAVGEVVRLAAALQALARPGSVLVGPVTRAAVASLFTWGEPVLAGSAPSSTAPSGPSLTATYLGEPRPGATGPRPASPRRRGPLVGRQAELAALGNALREAVCGRGLVVLVTGEPGLGKTRLVQEARRRAPAGTVWLEGRCASYASSTPYSLFQQLLANWAKVTPDQAERVVRPALERVLATVDGRDVLPFLARMMGLPAGAALGRVSPGELQRGTFAAWRRVVSRLVAAAPVVLVLEDLHWADPTSLRLTLDLAGLAAGRRLLILATSRTPLEGPVFRVDLKPLPEAAEEELARSLIGALPDGAAGPSREVLDAVLASADGNPLFLEERLAMLLETRALVRDQDGWRLNQTAGPQLPQALERLVRARVDRLSPAARDAVRPASVLGTEFPLSLLDAVCAPCLEAGLAELCERDLLREVTREPEPIYRFRHALIQEAVYNSLLGAERRLLHGRAAWALEAAAGKRTEEVAAVLGRHFAAAGEKDRALRYYKQAGDHATDAFANDEAIASFEAALAIVREPPVVGQSVVGQSVAGQSVAGQHPVGSPEADNAAADLLAKLANVLWRTGRRGAARNAFTEALRLASEDGLLRRAHLLIRLGRLEEADGRHEEAWAAWDAAETLLGENPGERDTTIARLWLELMVDGRACQYTHQGQPERALAVLAAVRPVLEIVGLPATRYSFYLHLVMARVLQNGCQADENDLADLRRGLAAAMHSEEEKDAGYATFFVGQFQWLLGDLAQAGEYLERALAMAERIGESTLLGRSLLGLALTALRRHDPEGVRALLPRILAAAATMGNAHYLAGVRACQAWLAWQDGRRDDVLSLAGEFGALRTATQDPWVYYGLVHLWPLVAAHLDAGDVAAAIAVARDLPRHAPPLPAPLQQTLTAAATAWDEKAPALARAHLTTALTQARTLNYL